MCGSSDVIECMPGACMTFYAWRLTHDILYDFYTTRHERGQSDRQIPSQCMPPKRTRKNIKSESSWRLTCLIPPYSWCVLVSSGTLTLMVSSWRGAGQGRLTYIHRHIKACVLLRFFCPADPFISTYPAGFSDLLWSVHNACSCHGGPD